MINPFGIPQPKPVASKPPGEWPMLVRPLKPLAQPGDKGLGDIVERQLGVAGETFKQTYAAVIGKPCGCTNRRDWLNQKYPL